MKKYVLKKNRGKLKDKTAVEIKGPDGKTTGPMTDEEFKSQAGQSKAAEVIAPVIQEVIDKVKDKLPRYLPEKVFALWKAASTDEERPHLRVVRIEPGKAMATDGHILLTIIPSEKFDVDEPFTVESEMCNQILKAKSLSGEDAVISLSNGSGPIRLSVGKYTFSPTAQLELFAYEPLLSQKTNPIGRVGFSVATLEKFLKSLKTLGAEYFAMEIAGETDPVKITAQIDGLDIVQGAVMPARV